MENGKHCGSCSVCRVSELGRGEAKPLPLLLLARIRERELAGLGCGICRLTWREKYRREDDSVTIHASVALQRRSRVLETPRPPALIRR
jgi:hypothetical protein